MSKQSIKRTTITVPDYLAGSLREMTGAATKTAAVVTAIHGEIRRQKLKRIRALAGKIRLGSSTLKGRHHDHRLR